MKITRLITLQLVLAVVLGPMTLAAHGGPIAIEFFNAKLGHYFLSADEPEIASLRDNPALGWAPTGQQFAVFDRLDVSATVRPVCRFYGSVTPGPNSHFYTANDNECSGLKALQATIPDSEPRWNFEGIAFAAILPLDGECASPSPIKVFRAYNDQA
ncbi:MAG: hypothetical protein ABJB04_05855, partial [Betaproteobacteria bacterium]